MSECRTLSHGEITAELSCDDSVHGSMHGLAKESIMLYWLLLRLGLSLISQINAFDRGKVVYQIPSRRLFINVFSLRRPL